jgi:uncharacterized protein
VPNFSAMGLDKRLLEILCCPTTKQPVGPASAAQLAALNAAVGAGTLVDGEGARIAAPFEAALVTRDGRTVYRVDDGIPVMLADQAVATAQLPYFPG